MLEPLAGGSVGGPVLLVLLELLQALHHHDQSAAASHQPHGRGGRGGHRDRRGDDDLAHLELLEPVLVLLAVGVVPGDLFLEPGSHRGGARRVSVRARLAPLRLDWSPPGSGGMIDDLLAVLRAPARAESPKVKPCTSSVSLLGPVSHFAAPAPSGFLAARGPIGENPADDGGRGTAQVQTWIAVVGGLATAILRDPQVLLELRGHRERAAMVGQAFAATVDALASKESARQLAGAILLRRFLRSRDRTGGGGCAV